MALTLADCDAIIAAVESFSDYIAAIKRRRVLLVSIGLPIESWVAL